MGAALWRVDAGGEVRWAHGDIDAPRFLLDRAFSLDAALAAGRPLGDAAAAAATDAPADRARPLVPLESQPLWGAGVTYSRSRDARMEESDTPDFYARVYEAERPELFVKALPGRVRGPGELIGIRADSTWDVPEPELAVVVDARGRIAAYAVGNDVSSRSIEGENPLYLPQAKTYRGSAALGPCLVPVESAPPSRDLRIVLEVRRDRERVYADEVDVAAMRRTPDVLVDWLFRCDDHPHGVALLTGTAIVPASSFTLRAGDDVRIAIARVGTLKNAVEVIGL